MTSRRTTPRPALRRSACGLVAAVLALLAARSAAAQTAAILPVQSGDPQIAAAAETAMKDALLGGGYLILAGPPVVAAVTQTGIRAPTTMEEGRRLGSILGADVLVSAALEPTWLSVTVLYLPTGSIEVREGQLPPEGVNLALTLVANLADAIRVMAESGNALPIIEPPPTAPPPIEPPPVEPPPVEPPPVEPPPVEPPPPEEPPIFYEEGPFHLRIMPGMDVLLGSPALPGGSQLGGRIGAGIAYAIIPECDLGLELDVHFGMGTAIDVALAATYRFPIWRAANLDIAPHVSLGYFQLLTGLADPAFLLRAQADFIFTLVPGWAIYVTPASFSLVAGDDVRGLYEFGLGLLAAF